MNSEANDQVGWAGKRARQLAVAAALVAAVVYLPALKGEFIWDDQHYITGNSHLRHIGGQMLRWALTESYVGNWHPLTWLSHALDVALFGYQPAGHHAMSILIHALNAGVLLLLLMRMTGRLWCSAAVAILFAVHPLHVESVAWITARKDLLSMLFFLLAAHLYVSYARRPSIGLYLGVLALFAAGLASKPMLVTFPFVLLLFDYWPLGRLNSRAVLEKIPMLVLSVASSVVTIMAQARDASLTSLEVIGLGMRFTNAVVSYARYMVKTLWPLELSPYYPYPGIVEDPYPFLALPAALVLLGAVTYFAVRHAKTRPYVIVGWLFYLGTLVPVIGLVQVGRQAMADRYTYLPLTGLFIAAVWLVDDWLRRSPFGPAAWKWVAVAATLAGLALAGLTWRQIGFWRTSEQLWRHALETAPRSSLPHFNLGNALFRRGELDAAVSEFELAIKAEDPRGQALAHYFLALVRKQQNRFEDALSELDQAMTLEPQKAEFRGAYANTLFQLGRVAEAEREYLSALALDAASSEKADVHRNYAALLLASGRTDATIEQCRRAVELAPSPVNYEALVVAYARGGKIGDAITTAKDGLRANPGHGGLATRLRQLEAALQSGTTPG